MQADPNCHQKKLIIDISNPTMTVTLANTVAEEFFGPLKMHELKLRILNLSNVDIVVVKNTIKKFVTKQT